MSDIPSSLLKSTNELKDVVGDFPAALVLQDFLEQETLAKRAHHY